MQLNETRDRNGIYINRWITSINNRQWLSFFQHGYTIGSDLSSKFGIQQTPKSTNSNRSFGFISHRRFKLKQFETSWFQKQQIHTRFQAPQISVQGLLDNKASSPLFMLRSLMHFEYTDGFTTDEERMIRHHARLLSCSIKRAFLPRPKPLSTPKLKPNNP